MVKGVEEASYIPLFGESGLAESASFFFPLLGKVIHLNNMYIFIQLFFLRTHQSCSFKHERRGDIFVFPIGDASQKLRPLKQM